VPATRSNRLNNPLRKLRLILGDGKTPLTQEEFASRTGLPLASFRSIEGGRRPLSKHFQVQIMATLGATWDQKKQAWFVLGSNTPYEKKYEDFAFFFDPEDPYIKDLAIHMLLERILMMFDCCTSYQSYLGLLIYLNQHLLETAKVNGLHPEGLSVNEPIWSKSTREKEWAGERSKWTVFLPQYKDKNGYRSIAPEQIFDFRSARTFRIEDYRKSKTPTKCDETVQKRITDTEPEPGKNEILTAPIPHPTTKKVKSTSGKMV
jgi:transcriptional regulator with XRE-family HTH domain